MGYYTTYNLSLDKSLDEEKLIKDIMSVGGYGLNSDLSIDHVKWYDALDNMKVVSKMYSDVLFTLDGEGEESGDIWTAYFKNGKMQYEKAVIQTAPFDEGKLK